MLLHIRQPTRSGYISARILDTDSGIAYEFSIGFPTNMTIDESFEQGATFAVVTVYSIHETTEDAYGTRYEGVAANKLWNYLFHKATKLDDFLDADEYPPDRAICHIITEDGGSCDAQFRLGEIYSLGSKSGPCFMKLNIMGQVTFEYVCANQVAEWKVKDTNDRIPTT